MTLWMPVRLRHAENHTFVCAPLESAAEEIVRFPPAPLGDKWIE
jgi:hypothetical protein